MAARLLLMMLLMLLLAAPSHLSGQSEFSVHVDQEIYRADEHGDVKMRWRFPARPDVSPRSVCVDVMRISPARNVFLFINSEEDMRYPDEQYKRRVRCEVKLSGTVECVFTQLRHDDSGQYQCVVVMEHEEHFKICELAVDAAETRSIDEKETPTSGGRPAACVTSLLLTIAAAVGFFLSAFC